MIIMNKVWLHFIKGYLGLGLFFYFRRIRANGLENIPKDKATLLLSNHQNALLDALIIATRLPRFAHFLTRAGVFKKKFVSKLLASFNMLPVYRIRDGWNNLTNNNPVFERCSDLLKKGEMVTIFPEGSHNLARRVRPLSKGFTRIVFDTLEKYPDLDLLLVPIGLNFQNALNFPDEARLIVGQPIKVHIKNNFNRHEEVAKLKSQIQSKLRELTTHIDKENYDKTLQELMSRRTNFLEPNAVNQAIQNAKLEMVPVRDSSLDSVRKLLKMLSILNIIPPYLFWKLWLEPKITEIEFRSTFRFAICVTLVPIFWAINIALMTNIFGVEAGIYYAIASLVLFLLTVKL